MGSSAEKQEGRIWILEGKGKAGLQVSELVTAPLRGGCARGYGEGSCSFPPGASLLLTLKFAAVTGRLLAFLQVEAWVHLSPGTFQVKAGAVSRGRIADQAVCVWEPGC